MVKICKSSSSSKKKYSSEDKTVQRQRILEKSFAKLNAELSKKEAQNNESRRPKNIFMDILKIPPVIDLANLDETSTQGISINLSHQQLSIQQHEEDDDLILLDSTSPTEEEIFCANKLDKNKATNNKKLISKRKRALRKFIKKRMETINQEVVVHSPVKSISAPISSQGEVASSSTISDIDLREENGFIKLDKTILIRKSKQKAVQKLKEHFCVKSCEENSTDKAKSDLDLRKKFQQEFSEPSTSTNVATTTNNNNKDISIIYTNEQLLNIRSDFQHKEQNLNFYEKEFIDYNTWSNRIRFKHRSMKIDLTKNYKLVGLRYFQEILGKEVSNSNKFVQIPLTVVSFNVLCQYYVETMNHLYNHLKPSGFVYASWKFRAEKLQEEFARIDADVFCLQEVQDVHFAEFYKPYFASRNFCGIFTRKTGGLKTPDGCAIFWKQSKLSLLHLTSVANNNLKAFNNPSIGQVAIFGLNESLNSSSAICISNTHIYFNMKKGTIKLAQIAYLLGHMKKVETAFLSSMKFEKSANKKFNFVGHILCGDFNIEPFSPLHSFLLDKKINLRLNSNKLAFKNVPSTSGDVLPIFGMSPPLLSLPFIVMSLTKNCQIVDRKSGSYDKSLFKPSDGLLTHDFSFASVYEHLNVNDEPEISSYHIEQSSPDFIFYTIPKCNGEQMDANVNTKNQLAVEGMIQLRKRLSLPTKAELDKACGKLPNEHYGSDHLLLFAQFDIFCPLIDINFS